MSRRWGDYSSESDGSNESDFSENVFSEKSQCQKNNIIESTTSFSLISKAITPTSRIYYECNFHKCLHCNNLIPSEFNCKYCSIYKIEDHSLVPIIQFCKQRLIIRSPSPDKDILDILEGMKSRRNYPISDPNLPKPISSRFIKNPASYKLQLAMTKFRFEVKKQKFIKSLEEFNNLLNKKNAHSPVTTIVKYFVGCNLPTKNI